MLSDQIKGNTDVLMVSETKTDNGFLNGILLINGFSTTYKLDRNSNSARLIPAGNYLFKVNHRNTRTTCEICSKLKIKTPERRQASFWCLYF